MAGPPGPRLCNLSRPLAGAALLFAMLAGCAAPQRIPKRPPFSAHPGIKDPADTLKVFYDWRLEPRPSSYGYGKMQLEKGELRHFFDVQGDTVAASWVGKAHAFRWTGLALAGALAGGTYAVAYGQPQPPGEPATSALALLPGALLYWAFEYIGEAWFRKPAVAKYNRDLKRELGILGE